MPYTVHPPKQQQLTVDEAEHFLVSWWRVAAPDGSTAAYAPDAATAATIAVVLTDLTERPERETP